MNKMRWILAATLLAGAAAAAQSSSGAPAGATGMCKDGTYATNSNRGTACQGHYGVQTWYATGATPATQAKPAASPAPVPLAAAPAAAAPSAPAPAKKLSPAQAAAQKPQAPGGGKGLVWVNTSSNVYHCSDDPYYGRTKAGSYMTEADAKAKGAHGDRGQACTGK